MGEILGVMSTNLLDENEKVLTGPTRLRQLLILETAFLIWKVRNERAIQDKPVSLTEMRNRWKSTIEGRRNLDFALSTTFLRGKVKFKQKSIFSTWKDTALAFNENGYTETRGQRGLVGMTNRRQS